MYYMKINGVKRPISAGAFYAMVIPALALIIGMLYLIYAMFVGVFMYSGWLGLISFILCFGVVNITANGVKHKYTLIQNDFIRTVCYLPFALYGLYIFFSG